MNIKKITPMFNKLVTTANRVKQNTNEIIIDITKINQVIDDFQTVVSIGSSVRDIKVGDLVCINPDRYAVKKYQQKSASAEVEGYENTIIGYDIPRITLDDVEHLMITDSDVIYIVDEYEKIKKSTIIDTSKKLIIP